MYVLYIYRYIQSTSLTRHDKYACSRYHDWLFGRLVAWLGWVGLGLID